MYVGLILMLLTSTRYMSNDSVPTTIFSVSPFVTSLSSLKSFAFSALPPPMTIDK